MTPTFTIITPTVNRPSLKEAYASLAPQMADGDCHLIVTDGIPTTQLPYMPKAFAVRGPETNRWGNAQRKHALNLPRETSHVLFLDDDDIMLPGALDAFRKVAGDYPGRLILARFQPHEAGITWGDMAVREGNVGTPCICVPSTLDLTWGSDRYQADYDFIVSAVKRFGEPIWLNRCVQIARHFTYVPTARLEPSDAAC